MTGPWRDRTVTGHIPLSLDGRVTGPAGSTIWAGPSGTPRAARPARSC